MGGGVDVSFSEVGAMVSLLEREDEMGYLEFKDRDPGVKWSA